MNRPRRAGVALANFLSPPQAGWGHNLRVKRTISILVLMVLAVKLPAQETNAPAPQKIGTAAAVNYYGQEMIVTGRVAQVTIRPAVTFLNLDKAYPDSPFTIVIFHGHSSFYGDANSLKGRSVEIKGKIINYHNQPEIALDNTNQLSVIGGWVPVAKPPVPVPPPATNAPPPAPAATNLPEIL